MSMAAASNLAQEPLLPKSSNVSLGRTKSDNSHSKRHSSGSWKEHVPVFLRPKDRPDPRFPRRAGLLMEDFEEGGESSLRSFEVAQGPKKEEIRPILHKAQSLDQSMTTGVKQNPPLLERRVRFSEGIQKLPAQLKSETPPKEAAAKKSKGKLEKPSNHRQDKSFKPRLEKAASNEQSPQVLEIRPVSPKVKSKADHFDHLPKHEGALRERLDYHVREVETLHDMTKHFNRIKDVADSRQGEMEATKDMALRRGHVYEMRESLHVTTCLTEHLIKSRDELGKFIAYHRHEIERCVNELISMKGRNGEEVTLPAVLQTLPNDYEWKALFLY